LPPQFFRPFRYDLFSKLLQTVFLGSVHCSQANKWLVVHRSERDEHPEFRR
jgi:hypothetical protein